jgi:hypothetical protein
MRNEETTKRALAIISRAIENGYRPDELCSSCVKELVKDINNFSKMEDIGVFEFDDFNSAIKYAAFMHNRGWRVSKKYRSDLEQISILCERYLIDNVRIEGIVEGELSFEGGLQHLKYKDNGEFVDIASLINPRFLIMRRIDRSMEMYKNINGNLSKANPETDMVLREDGEMVWSEDCYSLVAKVCDSNGIVKAIIAK